MSRPQFDIGIIGGGISGLGIAMAATQAGLSCCVLEALDSVAQGTSNYSLRIIHGGFRYLQKFQVGRVVESIHAQHELLTLFPNLISPLPSVLPIRGWFNAVNPLTTSIAAFGYNLTSQCLIGKPNGARVLSRTQLNDMLPQLNEIATHGALYWNDAVLSDPERLAALLVARIKENGGSIFNGVSAEGFTDSSTVRTPHQEFTARCWVKAVGADATPAATTCGFNFILPTNPISELAFALPGNRRFLFVTPRGTTTAIGTWYTDTFDADGPATSAIEASWNELTRALPQGLTFLKETEPCIEWGLLPRTKPAVPRDQRIIKETAFGCEVVATKYTTFLTQGREVVTTLQRRLHL